MSNIRLRLAIDSNRNRTIEKTERLKGIEGLDSLDENNDGHLVGQELDQVYFEYGEDVWLQGQRTHKMYTEKTVNQVRLKSITLEPPSFNLETKFSRRRRIRVIG